MRESTSESPATAIDWAGISEEIECPLCLYNLRGLIEPRCPECGCQFEWAEVLDPKRSRHPYIFEHHRRRNVWSFWKTLWGGLRARKFWTTLRPVHKVMPRGLAIYWVICSCFLLLAPVADCLKVAVNVARNNAMMRNAYPITMATVYTPQKIQQLLDKQAPRPLSMGFIRQVWRYWSQREMLAAVVLDVVTILLWPWLTLGALMIFQASMRKAKVQKSHVLRCVIYSADASVWYLLFTVLAMVALIINSASNGSRLAGWSSYEWAALMMWALWLVRLDRLAVAYKKYLQFDHPFLTVLASQIVVVLGGAAMLFWGGRVVRWMIWGVWRL